MTPSLKKTSSLPSLGRSSFGELFIPALMFFFGFSAFSSMQFHGLLLEKHHGFDEITIGNTLMIAASTQFLVPFMIIRAGRWLRDPTKLLSALYLLYSLCLLFFPQVRGENNIIALFSVLSFITFGIFPMQLTTILTSSSRHGDSVFLGLRSFGTLGFASFCALSMILIKQVDYTALYRIFAAAAALSFLLSFGVRNKIPHSPENASIRKSLGLLLQGSTPYYLAALFLANMAIFAGTNLLGNFVINDLNGSREMVSRSWAIFTFVEIPLIWICIWLLPRIGLKNIMLVGILSAGLRLFITSQVHSETTYILAQLPHGLFYGATLSGFNLYIRGKYPAEALHGLQLVCGMIYGGMASSLGGKAAGIIWSTWGLRTLFQLCAALCILAALVMLWGFKKEQPTR